MLAGKDSLYQACKRMDHLKERYLSSDRRRKERAYMTFRSETSDTAQCMHIMLVHPLIAETLRNLPTYCLQSSVHTN